MVLSMRCFCAELAISEEHLAHRMFVQSECAFMLPANQLVSTPVGKLQMQIVLKAQQWLTWLPLLQQAGKMHVHNKQAAR